ncbi:hypothetical protein RUM43_009432 [Polyplax serrata]|uniref:Uncharacterized protein n=1 Tax=Polyplax serrata TaxID=468196 RepID=A0AAN8NVF3_POLSC
MKRMRREIFERNEETEEQKEREVEKKKHVKKEKKLLKVEQTFKKERDDTNNVKMEGKTFNKNQWKPLENPRSLQVPVVKEKKERKQKINVK